jgi:signal transduction histidine kinase
VPGERRKLHVPQREILVEIRCWLGGLSVITERPQVVICLSTRMKLSLRFRLAVMTLTIVILAAIIVGAATVTWRQVSALRRHFSSVRIESFHIAEHLQAAILTLNATLLRFVLRRERGDWESFMQDTEQLEVWLRLQHPSTSRERQEIAKVLTELAAYRFEANAIASRNSHDRADVLDVFSTIENASQKLVRLGYDLASAHRAAAAQLVADAQKSLALLQEIIFGALALLMMIGAWAIALVYREMIAPLQLKLVESRDTIERQEKLASLGVLAAGVAHEIRNPLTAIKARLFTLRKAVRDSFNAVEDADIIEREINRLERIVRDVLQFARPAEPQREATSAVVLLHEIRDLMRSQLEKSDIELTVEDSTEITIHGDQNQLKQVLLNLIRNGAESIGERGKIVMRVFSERVSLGGRPTNVAILEVKDNGKGIFPDVQKRLFDPFYTTKAAGTGLGLSIAARIIEQHGGALRYKTEVGRGTTFGIVLPLKSSDEK